jgi:hypothetical protein
MTKLRGYISPAHEHSIDRIKEVLTSDCGVVEFSVANGF